MYKTVFAMRYNPGTGEEHIDMCLTATWPPASTAEFLEATAAMQGRAWNGKTLTSQLASAGFADAAKLIGGYQMMQMRARLNMLQLHIVDSDNPPTDEELIHHAKIQRDARRRCAADA